MKKRYIPIRELGSGAFARVYLARDQKLNRDVAVKVFRAVTVRSALDRFEREAHICKNLRHPNIVQIYDASIRSKKPNIIMEYIDCGDLKELIERRPITIDEAISITLSIASALAYLHDLNILHRDIKPANIMIQTPFKAILMDFNLAFSDEFTMLTEEGFAVGTPLFMAPEILIGKRATVKSEIYSLGLIFYEMLCSGLPTDSKSMGKGLLNRVATKASVINPKVPSELDDFIDWITHNDINERCPSMNELIKELTKVQKGLKPGSSEKKPILSLSCPPPETSSKDQEQAGQTTGILEVCDSKIKTKSHVKLTGRIMVFSIFLLMGIMYLGAGFRQIGTDTVNDEASLIIPHNELYAMAANCDKALPDYAQFIKFAKREATLFEAVKKIKKKRALHYAILRTVLDKINKSTSFAHFVEYRYRLRQKTDRPQSDSTSNDSEIRHLSQCMALHWEAINKSSKSRPQDLSNSNMIFSELWELVSEDRKKSEQLVKQTIHLCRKLPWKFCNTPQYRAFFHTLILAKLYWTPDLIPGGNKVLFLIPPYENDNLAKTRTFVLEKLPWNTNETTDSGESFTKECQDLATTLNEFSNVAERARIKVYNGSDAQKAMIFKAPSNGVFSYERKEAKSLESAYKKLVYQYTRYIHLGWYLNNLSENNDGRLMLMELIRDCLKLSRSGVDSMFPQVFRSTDTTPGNISIPYACCHIWMTTAKDYLQTKSLNHSAYTVDTMDDLIKYSSYLGNRELYSLFASFIRTVSVESPLAGDSMRILEYLPLGIPPLAASKISNNFGSLLSMAKSLKKEEYEGWSVLMTVISNKLFLNLKAENKEKERASLTVQLLETVAPFYEKNGYKKMPNYLSKINGPEILLKSTLIHCCDAFLINGHNFLKDKPTLAKRVMALKMLKEITDDENLAAFKGGAVAAEKILMNKSLTHSEILANPLWYW